ncbi:Protein kinase superfamily protein [Zea mays]|uniref:Protein kinase superfamily protein n=1 Tax=Zea mays TaxID=4577 RepID=A0A1D6L532_MAIZE|nr:Protein kinase superfamily protein [Zea mays]
MLKHKFIEKCNSGASKMLAKIKVAKKIRATLAVQNELSDPDNTTQDVPFRINEDYGETVPTSSQQHMKHGTYNDCQAGDFGTMIVHTEDGDEVTESPIFPRTEFIPGLGSINSFTHDPKRAELISSFWAENIGDSDANKDRDTDYGPDMQESKVISPLTGTVKKNIGAEGTIRCHDNQINLSPGLANTTTKLNNSPSRKAFSVQDKVYPSWFRHQLFPPYV